MTRQEANYKILEILENNYQEFGYYFDSMKKAIDKYPDQRFGQLMCNYFYSDYRWNPSEETQDFMNKIFPINFDPFFEESVTTLKRLQ